MTMNINRDTGSPMTPAPRGVGGSSVSIPEAIMNGVKTLLERMMNPFKVSFPTNYYNPVGADSFDIRALDEFLPNETKVLFEYKAKEGQTIRFIKYGVFTNTVKADNFELVPTIDGKRILNYHGDPKMDFAINLSIGPDLTENCMIPCDFDLKTDQTLRIVCKNKQAVSTEIGARFRGYLVRENRSQRGFGG